MASELRVDTLKDSSGNNSVGMTYVAGGSAKCWINFNGTGTPATRDSFNASSLTDDAVGKFSLTFTNAMNNDDFAAVTSGGSSGTAAMMGYMYTPATSSVKLEFVSASNTLSDPVFGTSDVNGDLA